MKKHMEEANWMMLDLSVNTSPGGHIFIQQKNETQAEGNIEIEVSPVQVDALCSWLQQAKKIAQEGVQKP
jgi:hypothetical protein